MPPLDLLSLSLFTWYVSYVLVKTDGPFDVFAKVRARVTLGGLLACIVCLSVWMATAGYLLMSKPLAPDMIVWIGAASGAALWGHKYTGWEY